jgi:hypothetical protein
LLVRVERVCLRVLVTVSASYGDANTCKLVTPAKQNAFN